MAIIKARFSHLLYVTVDECSLPRHLFACLGLCDHKTREVPLKQYFQERYDEDHGDIGKEYTFILGEEE